MQCALGNFSGYTFHGATWSVEAMVETVREAGYRVCGLGDMNGLYGAVPFSQACERAGLRMVLGARVRIRGFLPGWLQVTVREAAGYTALCRLLSGLHGGEADWEGFEQLQAEAASQLWLSCPVRLEGGGRHGRVGAYPQWLGAWQALKERDWDNLWLEIGWHTEAERLLVRRAYADLGREGWSRWVLMAGARHRPSAKAGRTLELLQSIGTLTRVGQAHPDKLPPGDYGLPDAVQMKTRFRKVPEVLRSTAAFAEACRFDFGYGRLFLPHPGGREGDRKGGQAEDRDLAYRCLRGIVRRYGEAYPWPRRPSRKALLERLGKELSIVSETGYAGYFLVFAEVVDECRRRVIPLLARGSAAGSLICYALGVANVCPFRFGLSFERFLNRERMRYSKLPDIDLDLPWDRREEIMTWLYERHGFDRVAMIGGFAHYKGRAAVVEAAKALGVPAHEAHAWSRRLPHGSLRRYLADAEGYVEAKEAREDKRFPEAVEGALRIEGLPRHPMMHPCGMVIADRPLASFTPVMPSGKGFSMTQFSMDPVEDLGLLKMDLLGQAGLSVMRDCIENLVEEGHLSTGAKGGLPTTDEVFRGLDYTDERMYRMIREGGARGVFHIESPAMTSLLALCHCADIDCLVATVSVIRPGAANEDKKVAFARRYLGWEAPQFAHPVLEEVLGDTFGLMVYEEHILLVAHRFAGMDLGKADLLRRILIKKADGEALLELEAVFRASARGLGRTEAEIEKVWRELLNFSGFMFNKAHGAAYAIEAYQGCWLKHCWPLHFLAAVLNNRRGFYQALVYVIEILRQGGAFVLPEVNSLATRYRVAGEQVHIPLWQVSGLGERFLRCWERELRRAPFRDWADFKERTEPLPAEVEALARVGALRGFFPERHEAVWQSTQVGKRRKSRPGGSVQVSLMEALAPAGMPSLPEMPLLQQAEAEAELLGYPVSLDPFILWEESEGEGYVIPVNELGRYVGRECTIAGLQVCHRLHRTRGGELMKFVSLADRTGIAEVVLFPDAYRSLGWAMSRSRWARLRVLVEADATGGGLSITGLSGSC